MHRTDLSTMPCPVARSLERVGEWWNILILRDAFYGVTRFDDFRQRTGISPAMLTRRLKALVEAGLLERRRYSAHPPRDEYVLTERGRDFRPVILALFAWGNRHFAPEGKSLMLIDTVTGIEVDPVVTDRASGKLIEGERYRVVAGPAATDRTQARFAAPTRSTSIVPSSSK